MFVRAKNRGDKTYLQIVKNERVNGRVRQSVLMTLGRLDILQQTGQLDSLLRSGLRFTQRLHVLDAHAKGQCFRTATKIIGPALLFDKLWKEIGIKDVIEKLARQRRFEFSIERTIFCTVLHRLFSPGSDRAAEKWLENYRIAGVEKIPLHHFYRAMAWLGDLSAEASAQAEALPACLPPGQEGSHPPGYQKDVIEEALFLRRKDLFAKLDLVFFDTTSIYFEGQGGETLGKNGYSKDRRPDLKQIVVGMVLDDQGNPICSELFPGNTADITTLMPVAQRLKNKFGIQEVCIVADRGMISKKTIAAINELGWRHILGVRMRKIKEVRNQVLLAGGHYQEVFAKSIDNKASSPLKVKEVILGLRRYIVCLNEDQAAKDKADRETIIPALQAKLKQGDKSLINNRGYRQFLKSVKGHFEIDRAKVIEDERYDGIWVLTTNTDLSAADAALKYKQLWMVEDIFRTMKSVLQTRPIYHKCDETIRGHVFCSFLAIMLRKKIMDSIDPKRWKLEWADIVRDVDRIEEIEIIFNHKTFIIRTEAKGTAGKVFGAVGAALPPVLREK